jgi:hypothetical protein
MSLCPIEQGHKYQYKAKSHTTFIKIRFLISCVVVDSILSLNCLYDDHHNKRCNIVLNYFRKHKLASIKISIFQEMLQVQTEYLTATLVTAQFTDILFVQM